MDVVASNIAHADTTRMPGGGPYRRNRVVFTPAPAPSPTRARANPSGAGVAVAAITEDPSPLRMVYDPGHPDADVDGNVAYPNVDITMEMTDMLSATRAYEASVTLINATKGMALKALEIGRG